ncbi:flagellar motor protein MotB [Sphingomonas sp.]|jgi:hypothetical protein|uniref:flagellar motor protein MotB n=1 Tax=Sphingomonas sp. TaxID=28214 RepID=UPI0035C80DF9
MTDDFPAFAPARPLWLITLADLALLLVGFLVLVQATQLDRRALAEGLREGFGAKPVEEPIPVAAAGMMNFAPGSAALPAAPAGLVAWARAALADPRVSLRVAGSVDGSANDVDPLTRSGAVLAADRARAVAAALAEVAPGRMTVTTARPGRRQVVVTLAFTEPR